jgi:hypothetical protein
MDGMAKGCDTESRIQMATKKTLLALTSNIGKEGRAVNLGLLRLVPLFLMLASPLF